MTVRKNSHYRFIPINVYFPPPPKKPIPDPPLLWKNEYEIQYRSHRNNEIDLQLHFRIHPLWLALRLKDEEGLACSIDKDGWIGVYAPMGRRFSLPKHIDTLKALLRALAHMYQNPQTYLCMDTMTRVLCVLREDDENTPQVDAEQNVYRLCDISKN